MEARTTRYWETSDRQTGGGREGEGQREGEVGGGGGREGEKEKDRERGERVGQL